MGRVIGQADRGSEFAVYRDRECHERRLSDLQYESWGVIEFLSWGLPGFLTRDVIVSGIGIVIVPEPRDCERSRAGDCVRFLTKGL